MKSLAFSLLRTVLDDLGATSQSDLPRSLPIQSDPLERRTKVARDHRPLRRFLPRAARPGISISHPLERPPKATPEIIFGSIEKYTKTLLRSSVLGFLIVMFLCSC
uniref:Uncharacterized protein n=1 Tax=Brassica oleracea TaxID=3712 RepID=A0A3P6FQS5_BRAOL|nr:unnamed protein product [Brassica oleracea]